MQLKVLEVIIYARTSVIKAHLPIRVDELVVTRPSEPFYPVAKCYFTNVDGLASAAYREVAVSSREERRPCFLVSPGLLQNVSNL